MADQGLSSSKVVIGLVNGMIGGTILIMPLLSLRTGYTLIGIISIVSCFFNYFSSLLCLRHLRDYDDLDLSILRHFGGRRAYKIFYDIVVMISLTVLLILYFELICQQWIALTKESHVIPIANALGLFPLVYIMKKYSFGPTLLAYGIFSIIGYCSFLIWGQVTAPSGEKTVPAADAQSLNLASTLVQGLAIQTFFIPILKENKNRNSYVRLIFTAYLVGALIYTYIGYSGAYSFVNRIPQKDDPQTIEDYFREKQWQAITLEVIYLIHLYSAFPQFLLVAQKRFFSVFEWVQTDDVTLKQVIYVGATIFISLVMRLLEIRTQLLIKINGSIVSFLYIYLIPIVLHLKCVYFSTPEEREHKAGQRGMEKQTQARQSGEDLKKVPKQPSIEGSKIVSCEIEFKYKCQEGCEMVLIVLMVILGLMATIYTMVGIANK